jgi:hypothetical protein
MSFPARWLKWTIGFFALIALDACVGGGVGYEGEGYGVDYYEPSGYVYGDWGPGYYVGPYRRGFHRDGHDGGHEGGGRPVGHPAPRPFHPAASGRAMPSIPSRHR